MSTNGQIVRAPCVGCMGHHATQAKHLGGSTDVDTQGRVPGLWNYLMKGINVKSVVDVGCGRGISTRWFMDHGADVRTKTMLGCCL